MKKYDIAIIGAGAAGLSIAAFASQVGSKVILFESDKMGGDCLNYGCIPSKSLLSIAKTCNNTKDASNFGLKISGSIDIKSVMSKVHSVIKTIEKNDSQDRFESLGVTVIRAKASFYDKNTIIANDKLYKAKKIVIATGSSTSIPNIPGIKDVNYLTNDTVFDLLEKPEHLVIVGGGPIGCEMASAFVRLGSKVTVIEMLKALPRDDEDCADIVKQRLIEQGCEILENTKTNSISNSSGNISIEVESNGIIKTIKGTHLLMAAGRKANIASLDLEKANVNLDERGKIITDPYLRTTNKNIYIAGDAVFDMQFTHVASYHASIIIKSILFKKKEAVDYSVIPWVTYTDPELAHVGLTEVEARQKHNNIKIISANYAEVDRAITEDKTTGKIKVMCSKSGNILGVSIVGESAGDLITPWTILIKNKKNIKSITEIVVAYPTFSEIHKKVAFEFFKPLVYSKKVKFLVKILSWF